jgi:hypothetical protein
MASTKAYQARKREIELLNLQLGDAETTRQRLLVSLSAMNEVKDALLAECRRLTTRCSIFEVYIKHAYWYDLENPTVAPTTIPKCLKPYDAIKFAGGPEPMMFPLKAED